MEYKSDGFCWVCGHKIITHFWKNGKKPYTMKTPDGNTVKAHQTCIHRYEQGKYEREIAYPENPSDPLPEKVYQVAEI